MIVFDFVKGTTHGDNEVVEIIVSVYLSLPLVVTADDLLEENIFCLIPDLMIGWFVK